MSYSYKKYWQNSTVHQAIEQNKVTEETVLSEPIIQVEVVTQEPTIEELIVEKIVEPIKEQPKVKRKNRRRK